MIDTSERNAMDGTGRRVPRDRSGGEPLLGLVVALPFALFVAHGALFSAWQIDDAGISYAYARSLVAGDGLVAQPGAGPVEGFTNLLWVLLVSAVLLLFDSPGAAARTLSYGLVLASFVILGAGARAWFPARWGVVVVAGLATSSLITGFTAWTLSGLENGLYVALLASLLVATATVPDSFGGGASVGLVWVLLFATRPDAALLVFVPAIVWACKRYRRGLLPFATTAAAGLCGLTVFRALYFGDVVPNTYYAKRALGWELLAPLSWSGTAGLLFGLTGGVVLVGAIQLAYASTRRIAKYADLDVERAGVVALWATLFVSYLTFEVLPTDWMPEGRFATALFLLAPIALLSLVRRQRALLWGASGVLVAVTLLYSVRHTRAFVQTPPAPLESVVTLSRQLASVGDLLGEGGGTTVLLPDIGGALWEDRFEVVDLGGLVDRRIGRSLRTTSHDAFYDYVLEVKKPDLVWIHGYWREVANLDGDRRFGRDYRIVFEDALHTLYVRASSAEGVSLETLSDAFARSGNAASALR